MPIFLKELVTRNTIVRVNSFTLGSVTAALPAGGETVSVTGSGFRSGATVSVGNLSVSTTVTNSTSLTFITPANSAGTYSIIVYDVDGRYAVSSSSLSYFNPPVWTTSAGALSSGAINTFYSTTITATGGTITYSLTGGTLPPGLSLNGSTGVISGTTTPSTGTSTFTVTATNQFNQTTARTFSILISNIPNQVEYLVVGGGGAGGWSRNGNHNGGGGGGGGVAYSTSFAVTFNTSYTVTVGNGGTVGGAAGNGGDDSVFATAIAKGGGAGGGDVTNPGNGNTGGSGGGGAGSGPGTTRPGGSSNQITTGAAPSGINYGSTGGTGQGPGSGAGGGGAGTGGVGTPGTGVANGGTGIQLSITGSNVFYAGGGAGQGGTGGSGGGGNGATTTLGPIAGAVNTGGGGGAGLAGFTEIGAAGGRGIVIIAYPSSFAQITSIGGGLTHTYSNISRPGFHVYTFTAGSGLISW